MDKLSRRIISEKFRQATINHSISGLSNAVIGALLFLPRTTVATITKNFHNTGKQSGMKRGCERRSTLSMEHKEFINLKIDEDPKITLKCLVQKLCDII